MRGFGFIVLFSIFLFLQRSRGRLVKRGHFGARNYLKLSPYITSVKGEVGTVKRRVTLCGGIQYTPAYEICCNWRIHRYYYRMRRYTKCCGNFAYDSKREKCCHGVIHLKSYGRYTKCCGRSIISSRRGICCKGNVQLKSYGRYSKCCGRNAYNSRNGVCCNERVKAKRFGRYTKCCGRSVISSRRGKCCKGNVQLKSYGRYSKCCGRNAYNSRKSVCCNEQVKAKRFGRYTKCCGNNIFNSRKNRCCGTTLKIKSTKCDSPFQKQCRIVNSYREICCSGIKYYKRFFSFTACCGRRIYNSQTHFCCYNKTAICRKRAFGCHDHTVTLPCGNASYDPATHICCDGRITLRRYGDDTKCCGMAVYNIKTMRCCNDTPCARKPQPKSRDLRNDTCLYPSPEEAKRRMHCRGCVCPWCQASSDEVDKADELLKISAAQKSRLHELHTPWGLPKGGAGDGGCLLTQRYYITGYSTYLHLPLWVAYKLTGKNAKKHRRRENCFRRDIRLEAAQSSNCSNYHRSGYDRGHLAPNGDFNFNEEAALNSFLFSNMAPQTHKFNAGIWLKAESLTRKWAERYSTVYVISGTIFDEHNTGLRENDDRIKRWIKPDEPKTVGVPTHFYKIITRCNAGSRAPNNKVLGCNGQLDAIAFVLPHTNATKCQLQDQLRYLLDHVVTIREIELLTRVTFFSALSQSEQNRMKSYAPTELWPTT